MKCRTRRSSAAAADANAASASSSTSGQRRYQRRHHRRRRRRTPFAKRAQAAGVVQVASGAGAVAASLACRFESCFAGFLAVGVWTGAFYAVNGLLTVAAARTRLAQARLAITGMVLSLLAAMLGLMAIGMAVVGILVESDLKRYYTAAALDSGGCDSRCRGSDKRIFLHVISVVSHSTQIAASCLQSILAFKRYLYFVNESCGLIQSSSQDDLEFNAEDGENYARNRSEFIPLTERSRIQSDLTPPPALVIRNSSGTADSGPSGGDDRRRSAAAAAAESGLPPTAIVQSPQTSSNDRNFCLPPTMQQQQHQQQQQQQQPQAWAPQFQQFHLFNQHQQQQKIVFHY